MKKKSITKNYIYNTLYQILLIILPIITTPYISRVLGPNNLGIYSYTLSIATYFVLFGSLGIAMYGQREIAFLQDDKKKYTITFWEIVFFRIITMTISILVFYLTFIVKNNEYQIYYKILVLELIANILDISWFFQGMEDFKKTVIRSAIVKLVSVICIFTFVRTERDLIIYFIIYVLSNLVSNLTLWIYLPKYLQKINFIHLKIFKHLRPTIHLFIPQIAINVYTVLDKVMIGAIIKDKSEVGYYEQAQKIVKIALNLVTSLGTVMSPRIAQLKAKENKEAIKEHLVHSFEFAWFIGMPIVLGIIGCADNLVDWFLGPEFGKCAILIKIGSFLIIGIGLNNVTGIQYLISTKKENIFTVTVIIGAAINFTLNAIFIPQIQSIGAIIASVIAEIAIFVAQLIFLRKQFKWHLAFQKIEKYLFSSFIMFVIVMIISKFLTGMMCTVVQVMVGAGIYVSILFILRDELCIGLTNKFLGKLRKD